MSDKLRVNFMNARQKNKDIKKLINDKVVYFDRVTIWFNSAIEFIDIKLLKSMCKSKIRYEPMKFHPEYKQRLLMWRPPIEALAYLRDLLKTQPVKYVVNYVEVTVDFMSEDPQNLHNLIMDNLVFIKRSKSYYSEKHENSSYFGTKKLKHKEIQVLYIRESKITKKMCCHLEYRMNGKPTCTTHKLTTLNQLINFDHYKFFKSNIVFYKRPTKQDVGLALKMEHCVDKSQLQQTYSQRTLEEYCNKHLPSEVDLNKTKLQEMLYRIPHLKIVLQSKDNKKENKKVTEQFHNLLFKPA